MRTPLLVLVAAVMLAGCSKIMPKLDKVIPDTRTEYRKSRSMPDLEVPPDLTTDAIKDRMAIPDGGDAATYSSYQERIAQRKRQRELEKSANDAIKVLDNEHILAVQGAPKQVWPQLRKFMEEARYKLELDDEELGVIETVWDENAEQLTRQKFKIFAEAGEQAGTTLLYVSQRVETLAKKGDQMVWQPAERDAAQEKDLVSRLQQYLVGARTAPAPRPSVAEAAEGAAKAPKAAAAPAMTADEAYGARPATEGKVASLVSAGTGKLYLAIEQPFADAWTNVELALERAGYAVDQADKDRGTFYLRVAPADGATKKRGLLSKMKFWGKDDDQRLQLNLTAVGSRTEAVLLDKEGRWEQGEVTRKLLTAVAQGLESRQQ